MTRLGAYVLVAFEAIWRNRTRSILTMLGMIIGTSSIIGVLGISRAAAGGIKNTIDSFGSAGIIINPDPNQDDPASAQIYYRDLPVLAEMTSGTVDHFFPNYNDTYRLRANGISYDTAVQAQTDRADNTLALLAGRRIDASDVATSARVVLLSKSIANRFFKDQPAVGQVLRIGGSRFTVIGVYDKFKAALVANLAGDDYVEIPYSTFHQIKPGPMQFLQVFPKANVPAGRATDEVVAALHRLHGERAAYLTQNSQSQLDSFNSVLSIVASGLTAIGGVALVVAGIGIMNIMLVSVTERTREIGLRKSIGASRGDILTQFLLEAVLLSIMGGGIGTLLGLGAILGFYGVLVNYLGSAPIPYLLIVSVAVGFSTLIGTVFGTYPAYRASKLDPIAALRS